MESWLAVGAFCFDAFGWGFLVLVRNHRIAYLRILYKMRNNTVKQMSAFFQSEQSDCHKQQRDNIKTFILKYAWFI